jgi:DNA polymerase-3 subunit epsilon
MISFDIEGTGVNPASDRIIQLGAIRDGEKRLWVVNPGQAIPPEATAIHGISDADVAHLPRFCEIADEVEGFFRGHDLIGFNLLNYDIPLLWEEFYRAGIEWDLSMVNIIDAGAVFKKKEERTLAAAVKFYCNEDLEGAHGALADSQAVLKVWGKMLDRYPDIKNMSRKEQAAFSKFDESRVDLAGKIVIGKDGRPAYNIGKAKGVAVQDDPGFGRWMLDKDFSENTKIVIRRILGV